MSFLPIKELAKGLGDTLLVFLSANGMRYMEPIDDDWYAAHHVDVTPVDFLDFSDNAPINVYLADEPSSVLGCKLQYQSCDLSLPADRRCSPWGGMSDVALDQRALKTKMDQIMYWVITTPDVSTIIRTLKQSSLTSRFRQVDRVSGPLPVNQWKLEVENWHNTVLASLQGLRVDTAAGPGDSQMLKYFWSKPWNEEQKYLCKNQKIVSTAYTNFSMMWLVITLTLGAVIVLLEFFLESIVIWLEQCRIVKTPSAEWFSNDTLQLQRMAHEELGLGDWSGCTGSRAIPVTEKGQLLGILNRQDTDHPRLVNPDTNSDASSNHSQTAAKIDAPQNATKIDAPNEQGSQGEDGETNVDEENISHLSHVESQNGGSENDTTGHGASDFRSEKQSSGKNHTVLVHSTDHAVAAPAGQAPA